MAEEDSNVGESPTLSNRFQDLVSRLKESPETTLDASDRFCRDFCQVLMDHGCNWKTDEELAPLLEMYTAAILCFSEASPFLVSACEQVTEVLNKLSWSCLDLLLSSFEPVPGALWEMFQTSVKTAHSILQLHGYSQLHSLYTLAEEGGVWSNSTLCNILSSDGSDVDTVHELLSREGPELLHMRVKQLIKHKQTEKAARLAKACAEFPEFGGKKNFRQIYLVCLCDITPQEELLQQIKDVDCKEALDMICNLESEEDERGAFALCTAFFKRQLLSGEAYCAWELTLFWSKLLIRLESKEAFLEQCRLLARISESVYHILLLIKVVQAEAEDDGLSVCIEMCIQALKMGVHDSEGCNISICRTISCLLPLDLEVKQACQLTEFLIKPTLDSYYAVETLFKEPEPKPDQADPPIINSLRCDLLLALKIKWPFDPEFWDWKTLKRQCIGLMGPEAAGLPSEDKLSDCEDNDMLDLDENYFQNLHFPELGENLSHELTENVAEQTKKQEIKKTKEKGSISARFRNWQVYMQYCVLCDKEFLGHRIVKHALKHVQDGIFHCPICTSTFDSRAVLDPHVASHVKQSSRERLAALGVKKKYASSKSKVTPARGPLKTEEHHLKPPMKETPGIISNNNLNSSISGTSKTVKTSLKPSPKKNRIQDDAQDFSCPVSSCQKVFKYFRNLVAHVRAHRGDQEAIHFLELQSKKALCQYCHRQFVNTTHLNNHLQLHYGPKPYFCIQLGCTFRFSSYAEVLMHRKLHTKFEGQCAYPNCERIFGQTYLLYDHEAQHYLTFPCKTHCNEVFVSLAELDQHRKEHCRQDVFLELPLKEPQTASEGPAKPYETNSHHFASDEDNAVSTKQPEQLVPCTTQLKGLEADSVGSRIQMEKSLTSTNHLESCFVKLQPIRVKYSDPNYDQARSKGNGENYELFKDKKLFCIIKHPVKTSTASLPANKPNKEEDLTHVCPFFETCSRKYGTSKSLSRHVKTAHSEAFEEWKLSKKYERIAKYTSLKLLSKKTATSSQRPGWKNQSAPLEPSVESNSSVFSGHVSGQSLSSNFCSQLDSSQNAWPSPSVENLNSDFSIHDPYSSSILSDTVHTSQSYTSDTLLGYPSVSSYDDAASLSINTHTGLDVMNEASKYVSSSLRVLHALNGEQTCDLSQIDSNVPPGFNHSHLPNSTSPMLPRINECLYFSPMASEVSPNSVPSLGTSNKETSTMCSDALFSAETNCGSSDFQESSDSLFGAPPMTEEKGLKEFCNHELAQDEKGEPEDQNAVDSVEPGKPLKKIKSSKRTKWPAIIQDGKVICCRCYREFSSTKSLGGHLSKRSQCKPVEEIDLSAELPTSFLDFLNDPDISMVPMPIPANDVLENNHKPAIYAPSESNHSTVTGMLSIERLPNPNNMSSQDAPELPVNNDFIHPVPDKGIEVKTNTEIASVNSSEDEGIIEIERALQRLGLSDSLDGASEHSGQQSQTSKAISNPAPKVKKDKVKAEQKSSLKPFRCKENCGYGAMTKEALLNHLSRVHGYNEERIKEIKNDPDRFAPYVCHLCSKTFTRTTGLKIHYKNIHRYSKEEITVLKIGHGFRKSRKPSESPKGPGLNVNGNLAAPSLVPNVGQLKKQEVNIAPKGKKKSPSNSTKTCKTLAESKKNMFSVTNLEGPSLKTENHISGVNNSSFLMSQVKSGDNTNHLNLVKDESMLHTTQRIEETKIIGNDFESCSLLDQPGVYRPYRCLHEGCSAAFSIQHNLILHYKAMHQSVLHENHLVGATDREVQVHGYRCQVNQCTKVVSKVTSLLKHYLLLHRCTLEKASALLSGVEVGTFQCDQSKCPAHFTCHLKYIDHIKNVHKTIKVSVDGDFQSVNLTFPCPFKGCERAYSTKSNLLRHLIQKHDSTFETLKDKLDNGIGDVLQTKKCANAENGKENIANNKNKKTSTKKDNSIQRASMNIDKTLLKSHAEASAMCNGAVPLQYPCMIQSCNTVTNAEQSIVKHYSTHGLTKQFVQIQRSQFIYCIRNGHIPPADSSSKQEMRKEEAWKPGSVESQPSSIVEGQALSSKETRGQTLAQVLKPSSEEAQNQSLLQAQELILVRAGSQSSVELSKKSSVKACENTSIKGRKQSSAKGRKPSSVEAQKLTSAKRRKSSSVEAQKLSSAKGQKTSSVEAQNLRSAKDRKLSLPKVQKQSSAKAQKPTSVEIQKPISVVARKQSSFQGWKRTSDDAQNQTSVNGCKQTLVKGRKPGSNKTQKRNLGEARKPTSVMVWKKTLVGASKSNVAEARKQSSVKNWERETWNAQIPNSVVSSQVVPPEIVGGGSTPVTKRKRGRPRRNERINTFSVERKAGLRNYSESHVKYQVKLSRAILSSSKTRRKHVENKITLKLCKRSDLEAPLLKFRKHSRSNVSRQQQTDEPVIRKNEVSKSLVHFRNPLKIAAVKNVKIVMYESQSSCSELLKQLQDMHPKVILKKSLHS